MKIKTETVRVLISFGPREEVAPRVLSRSIWERGSPPVSITLVRLSQLEGVFSRKRDAMLRCEQRGGTPER